MIASTIRSLQSTIWFQSRKMAATKAKNGRTAPMRLMFLCARVMPRSVPAMHRSVLGDEAIDLAESVAS